MKHNQEDTLLDQPITDSPDNNNPDNSPANPMRKWIMRFGVAGFMFFFIKGLVWLAVIFGVGKCIL